MKILVVTQYFWPENFRINDLVSGIIDRGHTVSVLTGIPNYPEGKYFPGYGAFKNLTQEYNQAKVIRVPIIPRGEGGGIRLVMNYISFVISACFIGLFRCREKYDLIFVFEPSPVTVALPALLFKSIRNIPVMFWVQDLWPESLSATGSVKSIRILNLVKQLVRFIYRKCDSILITSEAYRKSICSLGGNDEAILYFPQSVEDIYSPNPGKANVDILNTISQGFWIMFAGNIGVAQDFETIISSAQILKEFKDIHWIIVGDGRMRKDMESKVNAQHLNHCVHFLGRFPLETMPAFFSQADVMLVTLKNNPIFALTIPAKIQSYFACGRPIIGAIEGEGSKIILEAGAGLTCATETPAALAETVLRMYKLPKSEREKMGMNGRKYYEINFDRTMLLEKLENWMIELTQKYTAKSIRLKK